MIVSKKDNEEKATKYSFTVSLTEISKKYLVIKTEVNTPVKFNIATSQLISPKYPSNIITGIVYKILFIEPAHKLLRKIT